MVDKLTENIALWKDVGVFQDLSDYADRFKIGCISAGWSVAGQMNIEGVTSLAVGDYYIKVPDRRNAIEGDGTVMATRNLALPDNAILLQVPMIHVHETVAGGGTLAIAIGSVTWTSDATLTTAGTYMDDGAGNVLVAGRLSAAEEAIKVTVAADVLTAGAFTIFIPYVQSV